MFNLNDFFLFKNLETSKKENLISKLPKPTNFKKGEIINGAGDTSLIETGQETHIHFEMFIDGKYVNPRDYII